MNEIEQIKVMETYDLDWLLEKYGNGNDFYDKGFKDAQSNGNRDNKEKGISLLVREALMDIEKVKEYYKNKLFEIENDITKNTNECIISMIGQNKLEKEHIEDKITKIENFEKDIKAEEGNIYKTILEAYQKGFNISLLQKN